MVVEDRPDFEIGQRVRVREEGGDSDSQPKKRLLGKEGTIPYGAERPRFGPSRPPAYYVEFDNGETALIGVTWLEPR